MSKIKGIIFDLDDTLYNEIDYVKSGYRKVATYLESIVDRVGEEIFDLLISRFNENKINVFNHVLEILGIDEREVLKMCLEIYRNQEPNISLESETKDLLLELKKKYKLGIITDGRPEGQWAKIKALGLDLIMDEIIVTDELGGIEYRKPHELAYLAISDKLKINITEMIYIGDNPTKDFIAPNKLGMHSGKIENKLGFYNTSKDKAVGDARFEIGCIKDINKWLEKYN